MKRIMFVLALLMTVVLTLSAQTVSVALRGDNLSQTVDILQVTAWSPFTADSAATVTSNKFSIAQYDSLQCWVYATSVVGVPKFKTILTGSFDGTNFSATLGTVNDTTQAKLEALTYVGSVSTSGATIGRLSLTGSGVTTPNEDDTIVRIYMVAHKRGH